MQNLNLQLFSLINAAPGLSGWHLHFVVFIAKYLILLVPLWLVVRWLWGPTKYRNTLLLALIASIVALAVSFLIGAFWYVPRPFVAGIGHTFLAHRPDSSFPSDHVTFMWAIAFAFLLRPGMRLPGCIIALFTLAVAWSRVYVGVHYPFDMLGAIVLGTLVVGMMKLFQPLLERRLFPCCEQLYRKLFSPAITRKWVKN